MLKRAFRYIIFLANKGADPDADVCSVIFGSVNIGLKYPSITQENKTTCMLWFTIKKRG